MRERWSVMVQLVSGSYDWSLVLSSWASLFSSTAGASSAWITVDHVYGLVARLFQTVNTKVKQCLGSPRVSSIKCFWSLSVSPSWMLISFHFAETLLATSFIRSDSSGSLSSPAYLLPKPASKESVKTMKRNFQTHTTQQCSTSQSTKLKDICIIISCKPYLVE